MAGALVGGAFLSAFFQVAFDRMASRHVLDFFKKPKLNQTLLSKLKIVLLSIDAVVDDAEQKQMTNPKVKDWIDMVKDAVFDAEDVLDEIDYEMCKRKLEAEQKSQTSAIGKSRQASLEVQQLQTPEPKLTRLQRVGHVLIQMVILTDHYLKVSI